MGKTSLSCRTLSVGYCQGKMHSYSPAPPAEFVDVEFLIVIIFMTRVTFLIRIRAAVSKTRRGRFSCTPVRTCLQQPTQLLPVCGEFSSNNDSPRFAVEDRESRVNLNVDHVSAGNSWPLVQSR